jgi:PAP2 superfamily
MTRKSCVFVVSFAAIVSSLAALTGAQARPDRFSQYWGARYSFPDPGPSIAARLSLPAPADAVDPVHHWNRIAIDTSGLDHTPVAPGETRVFGEQLGPGRAARAMAIVHIAIFDAVNSIDRRYQGYTRIPDAAPGASMNAAIAQAAHDTLVALFPSQASHCDELLAQELAAIPDGPSKDEGIRTGRRAASTILAQTATDGADHAEPVIGTDFTLSDQPGNWRQDPISQSPIAMGAHWGQVKPMVIESAKQYRVPPPPGMNTRAYTAAYDEVKRLGGDGIVTPTERTEDQTNTGIYWAYDGTPSLSAPPRLFNQITVQIAEQMGSDVVELARLLALVNVAMSDAGIASWESKYYYQVWRPITGIRESDPGTGPTGLGDGNSRTLSDPAYSPLGAPASNLQGPNFTPPFPAYPSGHAVFGGAVFQTLRNFYQRDDIPFTFVSDELNGETRDNQGNVRPLLPRTFETLSQAEEENGQSRIYLGIHWSFDKTAGIAQGRRIANHVFRNAFRPRR